MDFIDFKLSIDQVAVLQNLLKPYVELSAALNYQYRSQQQKASSASPVKAEKVDQVKTGE